MTLKTIPSPLRRLEPEMENLNARLLALAGDKEGFLGELLDYALKGSGKRVRPCLVHLAASFGEPNLEETRRLGLAVELIHIATLIHDDVIDRAVLRRSRQTVATKFGDENAVLLGDYVYAKAFQELARIKRPDILEIFADTTSLMCEGEIKQVQHRFRFDLSEKEYFSFIEKKTASLFESSCRAGALLGQCSANAVEIMARYGFHIGLAFQITDDLLDLVGEEARAGKTLRTDLVHGKMTLPLIRLRNIEKSRVEQDKLIRLLQNPDGETDQIVQWMTDSGSIQYAQKTAQDHVEAAFEVLSSLPETDGRESLQTIAQALLERDI